MRPAAALAPLFLLALAPLTARAYRPFDSTDADTAEYGSFELEASPVGYLVVGPTQSVVVPNLTLNYGFRPGWEIVLEGVGLISSRAESIAPLRITETGLYLKHVVRPGILQDAPGVSVATEFGALLPTYKDEPGLGLWWAFIVSDRFGPLTLHLNAAYEWTRDGHQGSVQGLIIEGPDKWTVRPVAELLGEVTTGGVLSFSGLIGAIWRLNEEVSLDAGLRAGVSKLGNVYEARLGVTWSVPLLHEAKP
jgi:hypothetical protein